MITIREKINMALYATAQSAVTCAVIGIFVFAIAAGIGGSVWDRVCWIAPVLALLLFNYLYVTVFVDLVDAAKQRAKVKPGDNE